MFYETSEDIDYGVCQDGEVAYNINKELNLARRIIEETGANLFLTGKAGTGKTTFLRKLVADSTKRIIVLAPTGVAAINSGGMTINSFFQFPFSPYIPGKGFVSGKSYNQFSKAKKRIISSLDLLVIDEISMVHADILDAIDSLLRRFRNPSLPFGGVQLLLIGDLRQLPPVLREEERNMLLPYYPSLYFFESHALRNAGFLTIELQTIYRQNDTRLIDILNSMRDGAISDASLYALNSRYIPGFNPDDKEGYIRLTTHNRQADALNESKFHQIPKEPVQYVSKIEGTFPENSFPVPGVIDLKEGCQVIFVKNDTGNDRRYYNGMIGKVTALTPESVTVLPFGSDEEIKVEPATWENYDYQIDDESKGIKQVIKGTFSQIPLKLAWAITIHKSQGLTFDKAIIDASKSFAPGQAYVAFSRCTSLDGLVLSAPISKNSLITDRDVSTFIESDRNIRPDGRMLDRLRGEYFRRILQEIFDFQSLKIMFQDHSKSVLEFVAPMHPEYFSKYNEATEIFNKKIVDVGVRFSALYAVENLNADSAESSEMLREKIRNGAGYFLKELEKILNLVVNTDYDIANKKYLKQLANTFETFGYNLEMRIRILSRLCEERFSPAAYHRIKAETLLEMENEGEEFSKTRKTARSPKPGKPKPEKKQREKKEKKPKGYSQFLSLNMAKQGKGIEDIAKERNLAPSTIVNHLISFIRTGELTLNQFISSNRLSLFKETAKTTHDFSDFKLKLTNIAKPWEISMLYAEPEIRKIFNLEISGTSSK